MRDTPEATTVSTCRLTGKNVRIDRMCKLCSTSDAICTILQCTVLMFYIPVTQCSLGNIKTWLQTYTISNHIALSRL